jgi:hypothetical protein
MGRGIRLGLWRCNVCGSATDAGSVCPSCAQAYERGDTEALKARSLEYLSARFGPHVRKDPTLYAAAIERRFGAGAAMHFRPSR